MPGTVTSQVTIITRAESADSGLWVDIGGGQGSGQNADIRLQGSEVRGRRSDNATNHGMWINVTAIDLSGAGVHLLAWVWCTHGSQLSTTAATGLAIRAGSSTANYDEHEALGSDTYPDTGGWQNVWLDISRAPENSGGTGLNEASGAYFGMIVNIGNVGGAAQNIAIDTIGYATAGLLVDSGTGGSPAGFDDFVSVDEGDATNGKQGVVRTFQGAIFCYARLTIADATATVFNDSGFAIVFADQQFVATDFMGITVDLQNASTDVDLADGIIRSGGTTRLGDFVVTGTTGAFDASAVTFDGLRLMTLTSACTLSACIITNSGQIAAAGANLAGSSVTNSTAASALLWDTNADPNGELDDMSFVSSGTGHTIELGTNTPATITLTGHKYSGYAATDGSTGNETIYNNAAKAVTINVVGGDTPSIRNGTSASTTVNNSVNLVLSGLIAGSRVYVRNTTDSVDLFNEVEAGTSFSETINYTVDKTLLIRVRSASGVTKYKPFETAGTLTSSGFSLVVNQELDE